MPTFLNPIELEQAEAVRKAVLEAIRTNTRIKVPDFDRDAEWAGGEPPLRRIAQTENPFGGQLGPYLYQFEGEEDLLHIFVIRADDGELSVAEGRTVLDVLIPELSPGLVWLKPGVHSQHFYFGHDAWLQAIESPL